MSATLFTASELVTRNNVNSRITAINTEITNLNAVTLYNNASGSYSTISLSESVAHYSYVDIFFHTDNSVHGMQRVYNPDNKQASLTLVVGNASNTEMHFFGAAIQFSSNSISWVSGTNCFEAINQNGGIYYTTPGALFINRVVGYK